MTCEKNDSMDIDGCFVNHSQIVPVMFSLRIIPQVVSSCRVSVQFVSRGNLPITH